ncbi:hypothetical protein BJ912DRAFT_925328 [Pholiota molesta]|nr:hypothetical protein BJ912DRAFT_925328 [Pholiota molesta]
MWPGSLQIVVDDAHAGRTKDSGVGQEGKTHEVGDPRASIATVTTRWRGEGGAYPPPIRSVAAHGRVVYTTRPPTLILAPAGISVGGASMVVLPDYDLSHDRRECRPVALDGRYWRTLRRRHGADSHAVDVDRRDCSTAEPLTHALVLPPLTSYPLAYALCACRGILRRRRAHMAAASIATATAVRTRWRGGGRRVSATPSQLPRVTQRGLQSTGLASSCRGAGRVDQWLMMERVMVFNAVHAVGGGGMGPDGQGTVDGGGHWAGAGGAA